MKNIEQWQKQTSKGTSGDMVHDILEDWKISEQEKKRYKNIIRQTVNKAFKMVEESKKLTANEIKEYIENLPTDGHDKWYFYHKELGKLIEAKYLVRR